MCNHGGLIPWDPKGPGLGSSFRNFEFLSLKPKPQALYKLYTSQPKMPNPELAPKPGLCTEGATRKLLSEKIVAKFDAGEQGAALYADLPKDGRLWGLVLRA